MADVELFPFTLAALSGGEELSSDEIASLSHLSGDAVRLLEDSWIDTPEPAKLRLLNRLSDTERDRLRHDFNSVYSTAMKDPSAEVRRLAVGSIVEDGSAMHLERLLAILRSDPETAVRARAAEAVAPYALRAELGELQPSAPGRIRDTLLGVFRDDGEDPTVRAAALASVGYLDSPDVKAAIEVGLAAQSLRLGAIRAMGRTANPEWLGPLARDSGAPTAAERAEIARALGELGDEAAAPLLADMIDDRASEVRHAAIAALGVLGGEDAREALIYALEDGRADIREAAERAISQLESLEDPLAF